MNRDIILFAVLLIIMCCSAAAASVVIQERDFDWYLPPQSNQNGQLFIHGFFVFLTMVILLQILIPISLYVSLELVKLVQVKFIEWDEKMVNKQYGGVSCRTLNITEDLGSVEHIFSDKTGTLTENSMVFRGFTIDNVEYQHLAQQGHIARALSPENLELSNAVSSLTLVTDTESVRSSIRPRSHHRRRVTSEISTDCDEDTLETKIYPDPECLAKIERFGSKSKVNDFMLCLVTCNSVIIGQHKAANLPSKSESAKKGFFKNVKKKLIQKASSPTVNVKTDEVLTTETVVFELDETERSDPVYEAESPDEAALVYTAKSYGVKLISRNHQKALISWPTTDKLESVKYLAVLPFDSTRKMMSVVVEIGSRILVLTKGADSAILSRLSSQSNSSMRQQLNQYSINGLRTMCVARRELSPRQSKTLLDELKRVEQEISNNGRGLDEIYRKIESDLELIGVTAIEDRLQPGVPETIEALRKAGLALWVLTGDKLETAIEIGRLCKLVKPEDNVVVMNGSAQETRSQLTGMLLADAGKSRVLAINGDNLTYLMQNHERHFLEASSKCDAVICCRTTPIEKGAIVDLVSQKLNRRTLAVGDGANDVAMIRNAHVGVGISGAEGRQAVMAADFALPRFSQLSRLILIHGHLSYARMARMIEYFYYKSTVFIFLLFWYQFHNKFSGR